MLLAWFFSEMLAVPHRHQAKVLKYPQNQNSLSLQVVTLRSQLIFFVLGAFIFLKLMGMGGTLSLFRPDIRLLAVAKR
ncbi:MULTISPECIES: hypothetical protein [Bacillus]|uniref:hypothetical protein n=1 Tax=Bacillus TaxID=1386 RepID=UPI0009939002|nr:MULTISPECIES: hypothetical protein [Bacillus]PRD07389.1 hypothetical protein CQ058_26100 [Bacillus sp. MYb56]QBP90298.1 hypothetical protein E1A90_02010 [Bacillus mycoides]QEL88407.1 hypothetical protein DN409_29545 [Bacillus mycoides]QWH75652.1 hypothetical protein EXW59_02050 [Bacillus mycoides]WOA60622.1 hypothetical protein RVY74_27810 [Bacillus mycoides]